METLFRPPSGRPIVVSVLVLAFFSAPRPAKIRMKLAAAQTANETVTVESLQSLMAASLAADTLQPGKMKKLNWADLQKNVAIIEKFGEAVPPTVARAVTRKHAENLLASEKWAEWTTTICPWSREEADETGEWTLAKPHMHGLLGETEEDQSDVAENFLGAFFNDAGCKMLMNVTNEVPKAKQTLLEFVQFFLSSFDDYMEDCKGDKEEQQVPDAVQSFVRFCRGVSALLDPTPGRFQAEAIQSRLTGYA